jgi:hypothetical protein
LLEEIYICTQHLEGMSYSDVLAMPTYERRFFLGQKTRELSKQKEEIEKTKEQQKTKNSKGSRTTRVSGEALKNKIKSGELPINQ